MSGYTPNKWVDREGITRYFETVDDDGALIFTPDYTQVTEIGTPVNEDNMNHIEEGIAAVSFSKYDSMTTYAKNDLVTAIVENELKIYKSLQDNNNGNLLSDFSFWGEVEFSGSGAYVGQIIPSLLPLTDAGLHLLDGALINGDGIYKAFVDYIKTLDLTASYFCTESEWQASVEQYGVCGKFVYDATANTVRLPKVTGILEGTIDANALGDLVEAGLPNITGSFAENTAAYANGMYGTGAFKATNLGKSGSVPNAINNNQGKIAFDASLSSPIYGNSTTVQPQTIKGYYYIVLATGTKTDIEVNIDNVVTDLNGKVNISSMVDAGSYIAGCAMPSNKYISLTLGATGTEYTAPANGWFIVDRRAEATGQFVNIFHENLGIYWGGSDTAYTQNDELSCVCPVKKGDVVKINYNATGNIELFVFVYAQGSESEAQ